jgi:hypothetical protein
VTPQRKTPPRRSPLKSSRKPIRVRKADPSKRRFAKHRDHSYAAWIASLPCILKRHPAGHRCWGDVQCCHVKARATGGSDRGNCFPACAGAHQLQHTLGIVSWQELFGLDLASVAARLATEYESEEM